MNTPVACRCGRQPEVDKDTGPQHRHSLSCTCTSRLIARSNIQEVVIDMWYRLVNRLPQTSDVVILKTPAQTVPVREIPSDYDRVDPYIAHARSIGGGASGGGGPC